jgi:hypothetical protein
LTVPPLTREHHNRYTEEQWEHLSRVAPFQGIGAYLRELVEVDLLLRLSGTSVRDLADRFLLEVDRLKQEEKGATK